MLASGLLSTRTGAGRKEETASIRVPVAAHLIVMRLAVDAP
jgi:hypothetical protein